MLRSDSLPLPAMSGGWTASRRSPLFGHMQHVGVPTRLIDATINPLIAAWFAVSDHMDADGRLFAFTVKSKPVEFEVEWQYPALAPARRRPDSGGLGSRRG